MHNYLRKTFDTASTSWLVDLPEGATFPRVVQIYTLAGVPVQEDHTLSVTSEGFEVGFGFTEMTGILEYDYDSSDGVTHGVSDQSSGQTVTSSGGTVNITVHQNNGTTDPN